MLWSSATRAASLNSFVICHLSLTSFRRVSAGQEFDQDHSLLFLSSLSNLGDRMRYEDAVGGVLAARNQQTTPRNE
jgi:hypothetical protein